MVQSHPNSQVNSTALSPPEEDTLLIGDTCSNSDPKNILSNELRSELCVNETDSIILPKKEKKGDENVSREWIEEAKKLCRAKRKKLQQLALQKAKQTERARVYKSLQENQLGDEQQKILHSSSNLGHIHTVRERLQRSLRMEKLGLELSTAEFDLLHPKESFTTGSRSTCEIRLQKSESTCWEKNQAAVDTKAIDEKRTGDISCKRKTKRRARVVYTTQTSSPCERVVTYADSKGHTENSTVSMKRRRSRGQCEE